jgi:hypothetical protein
MSNIDGQTIRRVLLEVVKSHSTGHFMQMQTNSILKEAAQKLNICENTKEDLALLDFWHDLFRTGHLAWGRNFASPDPPFFHLTELGRKTLEHLSRDPANPEGYFAHISKQGRLNRVAESYLRESLRTYNSNCFKATAVLVGVAAESMILQLRDVLVAKMNSLNQNVPAKLQDWIIKDVLASMKGVLDAQKKNMPVELGESYESYWPAFTQQIRAERNNVGHPKSIEPMTPESAHASLLIFPELMKICYDLIEWIPHSYQ